MVSLAERPAKAGQRLPRIGGLSYTVGRELDGSLCISNKDMKLVLIETTMHLRMHMLISDQ